MGSRLGERMHPSSHHLLLLTSCLCAILSLTSGQLQQQGSPGLVNHNLAAGAAGNSNGNPLAALGLGNLFGSSGGNAGTNNLDNLGLALANLGLQGTAVNGAGNGGSSGGGGNNLLSNPALISALGE